MAGLQFAGMIGARGGDLSGINRAFDRTEEARQANQKHALLQQQIRAEQAAEAFRQQMSQRQQAFQEQSAGRGFGLDERRLGEQARQFDVGQGNEYGFKGRQLSLEERLQEAAMGLERDKFGENARQFNANLGQRQSEFGTETELSRSAQRDMRDYQSGQLGGIRESNKLARDRFNAEPGDESRQANNALKLQFLQQAFQTGNFDAINQLLGTGGKDSPFSGATVSEQKGSISEQEKLESLIAMARNDPTGGTLAALYKMLGLPIPSQPDGTANIPPLVIPPHIKPDGDFANDMRRDWEARNKKAGPNPFRQQAESGTMFTIAMALAGSTEPALKARGEAMLAQIADKFNTGG